MSRLVDYEGPTNHPAIYLVGEAPGETEEYEGKPFVGGSGRILDKLLIDSGIYRKDCRIANVMRVRPPANNFAHFYVDKQCHIPKPELEEGRRYLIEDIKKCSPTVVVCMGNEALLTLFHHRGITDWRGSILWHRTLGVKVIPTIHPAMVMRMWEYLPLALFDFKRIKEESKFPEVRKVQRDFKTMPTFEEVSAWCTKLQNSKRICFDIETSPTTIPRLTAVGFADSPYSAICIPFTYAKGEQVIPYWASVEEELAVMRMIKEVLECENEKIAQNAQFDCTVLQVNVPGITVNNLVLDTMCGFHTLYPELPKSLATLCSIYTLQPYYKDMRTGVQEEFWKYNCLDTTVTFECAIQIEQELKEFGMWEFYNKYVHPLIPILTQLQIEGVKIDVPKLESAKTQLEGEALELQGKLNAAAGKDINVMSPKQLKEFLYGDLGLPPKYKRGENKETVNEEALEKLSQTHPSPIFELILGIRRRRKLVGTYLQGLAGPDGRARCSYLIGGDKDGVGGTETGRLSSRESIFGTGTNLQNIPKGICREVFVAEPGLVFVEADLSQAEARVVAYLSEEERLISLFERGGDIHKQNASWIFGVSIEEVTKEQRETAKSLVHASNYGIGPVTFAHHAGVSVGESKQLLAKYFDTFPRVRSWQLGIQSHLSKSRILVTPLGRKRMFFARWGDDLFRQAYAFVPQSTVSDILNLALIKFGIEWGAKPRLQVHDAFVVECREDSVEDCIKEIRMCFDIPIPIKGRVCRIPIEIKVGRNWQELKKVEV